MSKNYYLVDMPSLVVADLYNNYVLDVDDDDEAPEIDRELPAGVKELYVERLNKFFRVVHNVENLTLSCLSLEFASASIGSLDIQPLQLRNLKYLKLRTSLSRNSMNAVTNSLKISPNIESISLVINQKRISEHPMYPYFDEEIKVHSADVKDYWKAGLPLPSMLYHLKAVEIKGIEGRINELMFVELLLRNSMVLEELVLFSCNCEKYCKKPSDDKERRMKKFSKWLLKLPKASAEKKTRSLPQQKSKKVSSISWEVCSKVWTGGVVYCWWWVLNELLVEIITLHGDIGDDWIIEVVLITGKIGSGDGDFKD
ncbi:hypothetical protein MKW98_022244 [Papaver atlanticum]|uniref:FBD domain-containing protein n=1 Tax=Papaver atlanticum TaxID=357466 RepID=A0AAD4XRA3_9MAGN|nr:hypothetical protein MKW98_022244 [Papaver atlanticum]